MTALAIAAPFGLHGMFLLIRGNWETRRALLLLGAIVLALACLHFVWQYAVTSDPALNPYTLWWAYDRVGFGLGVGRNQVTGHTLRQAYINTRHSLQGGFPDLFGWGSISWIFIPFGLLALRRNWRGWLLAGVFPSLLVFYLAYWIGSSLYGPRYYYEGLFSLTLLSAAGIVLLAGWCTRLGAPDPDQAGWQRYRPILVSALLILLVGYNLVFYLPPRLQGMYGLYGITRARLEPFLTPEAHEFTPALVIVYPHDNWTDYGALLDLADPFLNTPFIFVHSRGREVDSAVVSHFLDRKVIHYYTEEPHVFYTGPRPED
jgi:hypothetical protein